MGSWIVVIVLGISGTLSECSTEAPTQSAETCALIGELTKVAARQSGPREDDVAVCTYMDQLRALWGKVGMMDTLNPVTHEAKLRARLAVLGGWQAPPRAARVHELATQVTQAGVTALEQTNAAAGSGFGSALSAGLSAIQAGGETRAAFNAEVVRVRGAHGCAAP